MRKASPLVSLILLGLAGTASAQDPAPAASTATPPAAAAAATTPTPGPTPAPAPSTPEVAVATAAPATPAAPGHRKLQVGLSLLPMAMGKYTYFTGTTTPTVEMYFAYGFALSAGYEVLPGLIVGLSPQVLFNVQPKPQELGNPAVAKEYDLMARVAYELRPVEGIAVYGEVLPGYSRVAPSDDASPSSGLVLAFGIGCAADLTDRFFINLGAGYQIGYQNQPNDIGGSNKLRTKYVRVALGGGVRF